MEVGKVQKKLCDNVHTYNTLVHQLELPNDYEVSSANISDNIHYWQTTLLSKLRVRKKNAKHDTYQSQSQRREKEEEINMVRFLVVSFSMGIEIIFVFIFFAAFDIQEVPSLRMGYVPEPCS